MNNENIINPRYLAVKALLKTEQNNAWAALVLDNIIRDNNLTKQDSAFLSALLYGTISRTITLDACIAAHSNIKIKKISDKILAIMRISVYQLLYMDVPNHSVVDEAVKLVKKMGQHKSTGFVNAVLRSFLRADMVVPVPKGPIEAQLSIKYSCPEELVKFWLDSYSHKTTEYILQKSLKVSPSYIRINTHKTNIEDFSTTCNKDSINITPDADLKNCAILTSRPSVDNSLYKKGMFYYQDKSSQLAAFALDAKPGMRILDVCSAPGGKTITISQIMANSGEIVACDLYEKRIREVEHRAKLSGCQNISTLVRDMTALYYDMGKFDRILCDVPCSGLGVIARKPEIKYKKLANFQNIPEIQYKILCNASQYLKDGGVLIYSTCTLNPAENEDVRQRFLDNRPDIKPYALPDILGGGTEKNLIYPPAGDFFYIAAFTKA